MRLTLVTDAWCPQVNGVVRTLERTVRQVELLGHQVDVIHPGLYPNIPLPLYPEIRLALICPGLGRRIELSDHVHIATEGPLGLYARNYCMARGRRFTTAYHTHFPDYLQRYLGIPAAWTYAYMRWFHRRASRIMVATSSLERELASWGFRRMARWSRGVDMKLFHPGNASERQPLALYVGRVAYEKNIEAFLQVKLPHGFRARVVGDGPALAELKLRHPQVEFTGALSGEALAAEYRRASVFVFPSRTDTFGLVLLESLASGVPVAAYPVAGPRDVLEGAPEGVGFLDEDLGTAISLAVARGNSQACCDFVSRYTWEKSTKQFLENLVPRLGSGEPEKNCPTHRNDRKSWRPRQSSLLLAR